MANEITTLLKCMKPFNIITRNKHIRSRQYKWEDGIQYHNFRYYPRTPDFKDPPYEPTKLFRVQRIKSLKGFPHWDKRIIAEFNLDGKVGDVVIVKNIPENNQRLWRIKHLVKITPITFPDGFPKDSNGTYLKENGELVVKKNLLPKEDSLEALDKFQNNPKKLDTYTLMKDSRLKWLNAWQTDF